MGFSPSIILWQYHIEGCHEITLTGNIDMSVDGREYPRLKSNV